MLTFFDHSNLTSAIQILILITVLICSCWFFSMFLTSRFFFSTYVSKSFKNKKYKEIEVKKENNNNKNKDILLDKVRVNSYGRRKKITDERGEGKFSTKIVLVPCKKKRKEMIQALRVANFIYCNLNKYKTKTFEERKQRLKKNIVFFFPFLSGSSTVDERVKSN